jgi:endonuclease YncB( thermonuclease family)
LFGMNQIVTIRLVALWPAAIGLLLACSPPTESTAQASRGKQAPSEQVIVGRASVIDGDTLEIHGNRIRLQAIDAPEARQTCEQGGKRWPCGRRAALALADLIGTRPVECRSREKDRWQRVVAVCRVSGTDINGWMVEHGWALAFRRYGKDYVGQEGEAREERRGVWAGTFVPPWEHRRGRKSEVSAERFAGS